MDYSCHFIQDRPYLLTRLGLKSLDEPPYPPGAAEGGSAPGSGPARPKAAGLSNQVVRGELIGYDNLDPIGLHQGFKPVE
jgi:hypothetical protein